MAATCERLARVKLGGRAMNNTPLADTTEAGREAPPVHHPITPALVCATHLNLRTWLIRDQGVRVALFETEDNQYALPMYYLTDAELATLGDVIKDALQRKESAPPCN